MDKLLARFFLKLGGMLYHGPRKAPLNFGAVTSHRVDTDCKLLHQWIFGLGRGLNPLSALLVFQHVSALMWRISKQVKQVTFHFIVNFTMLIIC